MAKPCIITFRGQKYSYDEFASKLYSGLLTQLTDEGLVDTSGFKQRSKDLKSYEEKNEEAKLHADTMSFDMYRQLKFAKTNVQIAKEINMIKSDLANPDISPEEEEFLHKLLDHIEKVQKDQYNKDYKQYKEDVKLARNISERLMNPELTDEQRVELINNLYELDELASKPYLEDAHVKFAVHFRDMQMAKLADNEKFIAEKASKTDLQPWEVHMKVLSHMPEYVPELQQLSKVYDDAHFDMTEEAAAQKHTLEKLGKAVISEKNKQLGIKDKIGTLFTSNSAKYFDYLEGADGTVITLGEAKAKGLSQAQIEFLKFFRELMNKRAGVVDEDYNYEHDILKVDPSFYETTFKQEGLLRAVGNFFGSSYNLRQVRIEYKDPETGATKIDDFATIENKLIQYGNKGIKQKAKAAMLIMKYNVKARKQLKAGINADEKENPLQVKGAGEYTFDYRGKLVGKFDRPRDKGRGYSKDFYAAAMQYIDDSAHIKHMSKIVTVVNSLEHLAKKGYTNVLTGQKIEAKQNTAKWIDEWRKMHLFKEANSKSPELDAALKFLRFFTSATTMMFNVPASMFNVFMGVYNSWRAENGGKVMLGNKRLFGKKGIDPYSVDILKKYKVVSTDHDSNPKLYVGRLFDNLGHGLTRAGEFYIQGSMFLGLMSEEEYNSFEYKTDKHGVEQLVVKEGVDEAALKEKLLGYKNRVSDIQGKYAEKDRRNIMNSEFGKAVFQFKVWMPDWWKERYGAEYINADGETKRGTWRDFTTDAVKELRAQIKNQGMWDFITSAKEPLWTKEKLKKYGLPENLEGTPEYWTEEELKEQGLPMSLKGEGKYKSAKNMMANLKGAAMVAFFLTLTYMDDDDDKKRNKAGLLNQALGNLWFIWDPDQAKFTITRPIAAMATIEKMLDLTSQLIDMEGEKALKTAVRLTPVNKIVKSYETISKLGE